MSITEHVNGLIAAPLTGYHPDGSVNLEVAHRYAEMLHTNGVAGAFVNGTTGEGMSLTVKERRELAERWVAAAPAGFKIIIHVGHTCQAESQALAAHAMEIGAYGIGEIGPVFFQPATVDALVDYCAVTAACAPELPYYYYHMPSMSHVELAMVEFLDLASVAIPNLAGIKFTYEDLADYEGCRRVADGKYDILFGRDEILIEGLKLGASGAVGSTYNIIASLYHELITAFHAGDLAEAQRLQAISADTCRIMAATGGFGSAMKAVLKMIGLELGGMRRPQFNLSSEMVGQLEQDLQEAGALAFLNKG
ncbi:dihydrodipicolinate synthase family protein [Candidatus Sumerlaeota bacterium]